tara:strand:- start:3099 stop:3641 length:543 start_codon:yes stop_codon:yes gene_type:complete
MTEYIDIRGTAHPAPPANGARGCAADLSRAEIQATNIAGRPLLNEHDHNAQVGQCMASWQGTDGSLRIAARVTDPAAIRSVRDGSLRGLSLGTNMILDEDQNVLYRAQGELSVCAEGRRPGTWVDTINGKTVMQVACASKVQSRKGARAPYKPRRATRDAEAPHCIHAANKITRVTLANG